MVFPEIDFPLLFPLSRCEIGREEWHIFFVGTRIDDLIYVIVRNFCGRLKLSFLAQGPSRTRR